MWLSVITGGGIQHFRSQLICWFSHSCVFCSPHSVHKAYAGESEKVLREAFAEASSHAMSGKPSVVFIDEIDALCPRRDHRYGKAMISINLLLIFHNTLIIIAECCWPIDIS